MDMFLCFHIAYKVEEQKILLHLTLYLAQKIFFHT